MAGHVRRAASPGEHNGTFRGIYPALVTDTAALRTYWSNGDLERRSSTNGARIRAALTDHANSVPGAWARGRDMAHGIEFEQAGLAAKVAAAAFDRGLLVETCGPADQVVKLPAAAYGQR